jgi:hypothetical protein
MSDWTLGALRARAMSLELHCPNSDCRRFQVFDLDRLIEAVGEDFPVAEVPELACEACGTPMLTKIALAGAPDEG